MTPYSTIANAVKKRRPRKRGRISTVKSARLRRFLVSSAHFDRWRTRPVRQVRHVASLSQSKLSSAHQHALNFGRSLVLDAGKHVGISLQRERNARMTQLV
jgi:hypothetical protein